MSTIFVDLNAGSDANNGSTFAWRKKTLSSAAAVAVAGDTVRVMGKPSTNSGTATWTKNSPLVTLSAAMNQLLYGDGAWTAATSVTATANTTAPTPKQGSNSSKLVCAAGFTTGKVAHWPTGSAVNLSTYQQISRRISPNNSEGEYIPNQPQYPYHDPGYSGTGSNTPMSLGD